LFFFFLSVSEWGHFFLQDVKKNPHVTVAVEFLGVLEHFELLPWTLHGKFTGVLTEWDSTEGFAR
jgi:hypothetical protein